MQMKTLIQNTATMGASNAPKTRQDILIEGRYIRAIELACSIDPTAADLIYDGESLTTGAALTDFSGHPENGEAAVATEHGVTRLMAPKELKDWRTFDASTHLTADFDMIDGPLCRRLGLRGQLEELELNIVQHHLANETDGEKPILFMGLGDARSIEKIARARQMGRRLICAIPLANFHFNSTDLSAFDPAYKLNPPLRFEANRQDLMAHLKNGSIDLIYSNHCHCSAGAKDYAFENCAFNGPTRPSLVSGLIALSKQANIPLEQCWPKDIFQNSALEVGSPADLLLMDTEKPVIQRPDSLEKIRTSPFHSRLLAGQVIQVWNRGEAVLAP